MPRPVDHARYSDPATLDFYDIEAPDYVASGKGGVSRWLDDFIRALPEGARVLELGCGGGRDAEAMLLHGFDVHPTDGSPAMAAKAEERLGRPVTTMRFDELSEISAYDAVWASASLLHVPLPRLNDVLKLVFAALKPGGLHFASYKGGGIPGRDTFGRYFNYPDRRALIDAYAASGPWELVSVADYIGGGYEGGQGPWIAITVRRPQA
ncbi:class I SAM-dependent methyltransferase [Pelagerythrobacter aerophilus]|uniref:Class I SAM-dependent methyltransferase n=1 Tax=Pelagerythrobacter aerophilus TaxID=2306995 RepID=A0A418NKZ4_9SPHN|nr:class I SAM-dependent methyltransferase [Pelagerythrobacter aerophilus]RIV79967.1 class I SAM-dependent methyltransferase [Pelagerythrobacter aerophilus]